MPDHPGSGDPPIVIEHYDTRRDEPGEASLSTAQDPVGTFRNALESLPLHFNYTGVRINDSDVAVRDVIETLVDINSIDHVGTDLTPPDGETLSLTHGDIEQFFAPETDSTADDESGDETPTARSPGDVLEDNADLYAKKNDDYGSSWTLAGETMSMWANELGIDTIDPSDPEQAIVMGLYWERLIKLIRGFNLELNDETPNNESTAESHADASTYAAMHASLIEQGDSDDE